VKKKTEYIRVSDPSNQNTIIKESEVPQLLIPKMIDKSDLITPEEMQQLRLSLPRRYASVDWRLLYSTQRHGISLNTFYSRTDEIAPSILIIQDSNLNTFGAFASVSWQISKCYYGTGESFLFTLKPHFEVFNWTRSNSYFMLSNEEFISLGGGGHYGLWLDSEFYHGVSGESTTYNNKRLSNSTGDGSFVCLRIEVWGFKQIIRKR